MPKQLTNNRIINHDSLGILLQHDLWLDQGVTVSASPTFSNLTISGDTTIEGNLYVLGNTTVLDTNVVAFEDNIIVINKNETNPGVTLNLSGWEVYRGPSELPYRTVFQESDDSYRIGFGENLKRVAPLAEGPVINGLATWDNVNKDLKVTDTVLIDTKFNSTTESTNITTGSIVSFGGASIAKNIRTNQRFISIDAELYQNGNGDLVLKSKSENAIKPDTLRMDFQQNVPITFGTTNESIVSDVAGRLTLTSQNSIDLTTSTNGGLRLSNFVPVTFSKGTFSTASKIYSNASNALIIQSPTSEVLFDVSSQVRIPTAKSLMFGNIQNSDQKIESNASNELSIFAGSHINLSPALGSDVRIGNGRFLKLGDSGSQRIGSNSTNVLTITATSDIELTPGVSRFVKIPSNIGLMFGTSTSQRILEDGSGNLTFSTTRNLRMISQVEITNTIDSINATTGSLFTFGGIGVTKRVFTETGFTSRSADTNALLVGNVTNQDMLQLNSTSTGNLKLDMGSGTVNESTLTIKNKNNINAYSLVELLGGNFDATKGYNIGRSSSSERAMSFSIPQYSSYSSTGIIPKFIFYSGQGSQTLLTIDSDTGNSTFKGVLNILNTESSSGTSTGSFITNGGISVKRQSYFGDNIIVENSLTTGFLIKKSGELNDILNVNTTTQTTNLRGNSVIVKPTSNFIVRNSGDNSIWSLTPSSNLLETSVFNRITNTTLSTSSSSGSLVVSGGVAIQKNLRISGQTLMENTLNMTDNFITNLKIPEQTLDAANKYYVDLLTMGSLNIKDAVDAATLTPITLNTSALQMGSTMDGYVLNTGDRVLVLHQTNAIENGIYIVQAPGVAPIRSIDFASGDSARRAYIFVTNGDNNGFLSFVCINDETNSTIGTHPLKFVEFFGASKASAGDGLSKTGSRLDVLVDDYSIEIDSGTDRLRIKSDGLGTGLVGGSSSPLETDTDQSHVEKLGVINTGTWQASTIDVLYGGTGNTQFSTGNIIFGNGTSALATSNRLYWNSDIDRLGLGTNSPQAELHITNTQGCELILESDTTGLLSQETSLISLKTGSPVVSSDIALVKQPNQFVNNSVQDSLLISHKNSGNNSRIQFATNSFVQMTLDSNGNIGIGTTSPQQKLHVYGSSIIENNCRINGTEDSTTITSGSLVVSGGVGISKNVNIGGDIGLYSNESSISFVGEYNTSNINATTTGITIQTDSLYLDTNYETSILSTQESIGLLSGSLITYGGVSIHKSLNVGNELHVSGTNNNIADITFLSKPTSNLIKSGNTSFKTLDIGTTSENIFTIYDSGIIVNNDKHVRIGGSLNDTDGFDIYSTSGQLHIETKEVDSEILIGTPLLSSDVTIYGSGGSLRWNNTTNDLVLNQSDLIIQSSSASLKTTVPNNSNISFVQANSNDIELNFGKGGSHQLTTVLSNKSGIENIRFTPFNTHGTLVLSENIHTTYNGPTRFNNDVILTGNQTSKILLNTNTEDSQWFYLGRINTTPGSTGVGENGHMDLYIITETIINEIHEDNGMHFIATIRNGELNAKHLHYGELAFDAEHKGTMEIFTETIQTVGQPNTYNYHAFVLVTPSTKCFVTINYQSNDVILFENEGYDALPNGLYSNFNNWDISYSTAKESNLSYSFGNVTSEGTNFKVSDNFPIVAYNNSNTLTTRDSGILFQRFQYDNDTNLGDLPSDTDQVSFISSTFPSQSGVTLLNQIKLNTSSGFDFTGWWLQIPYNGSFQMRKIQSYQVSTGVATLDTDITGTKPAQGSSYKVFRRSFVSLYYDEIQKSFVMAYLPKKPDYSENVTSSDYVNLVLNKLNTAGKVTIENLSSDSFETLGGLVVNQSAYIANRLAVGSKTIIPTQPIHIRTTNSNVLLEHTGDFSYIQFRKQDSSFSKGISYNSISDALLFTHTTSNQTPNNSATALAINTNGFVGIGTSQGLVSPLTINSNNLISTTSTSGFFGIVGGPTNSPSSSNSGLLLYGNAHPTLAGDVHISGGVNNTGGVKIFTSGIERIRVAANGLTYIYNTTSSTASTNGSLIVSGGISIRCTDDATSITRGGSLTIAGGAAIQKSLFCGENITIDGELFLPNLVGESLVNIENPFNCVVIGYENAKIMNISSEILLSFVVKLIPTNVGQNTQFEFILPQRYSELVNRSDVIIQCSGWTDDDNLYTLQNILGTGVPETFKAMIKFQSSTTTTHYIQIIARYTSE